MTDAPALHAHLRVLLALPMLGGVLGCSDPTPPTAKPEAPVRPAGSPSNAVASASPTAEPLPERDDDDDDDPPVRKYTKCMPREEAAELKRPGAKASESGCPEELALSKLPKRKRANFKGEVRDIARLNRDESS